MERQLVIRAWWDEPTVLETVGEATDRVIERVDEPSDLLDADIALVAISRWSEVPQLRRPPVDMAGPLVIAIDDQAPDHPRDPEQEAHASYISTPTAADLARQLRLAVVHANDRLLATLAMRLVDEHHEAVEFTDHATRILRVNKAWEGLTGYYEHEAKGRTVSELLRSDVHPPAFYDVIMERLEEGKPWSGEIVNRDVNGQHFVNLLKVTECARVGGRPVGTTATRQTIRAGDFEQRAVDPALTAFDSAQLYSRIVAAADDGIFVLDGSNLNVIDSNPAGLRHVGLSLNEVRQLTFRELVPTSSHVLIDALVRQLSREGSAEVDRLEMTGPDGAPFVASVRVSSLVVQGRHVFAAVVRDVSAAIEREQELARTHKRLLEEQRRTQRTAQLATLGELAAGVAHEVNNPAGFVLLNLEHLQEMLADGALTSSEANVADILDECVAGMKRIGTITRELLPFAASPDAQKVAVDVKDEVERALRIVDNEVRHRGRLERELDPVPPVMATAGRVSQLVTNLVINAVHALDEERARENRIVVSLRRRDGGVSLHVSDTGAGIPKALQERIFERFFTTKKRGEGTGLGLALCSELVYDMGGRISVDSEVGRGSTFKVWLPAAQEQPEVAHAQAAPAPEERHAPRVLIIDDEPQLLAVQGRMLSRMFEVHKASGGQAAIDLLAVDDDFDAVLCDLMMPDVDGAAVFEVIEAKHPHLAERVVFQSGGVFHDRLNAFVRRVDNTVLAKPVARDDLVEALKRVVG